ncbi:MAG: hypothetical protein ACREBS_10515 [Nitrososphaerales archaeon]
MPALSKPVLVAMILLILVASSLVVFFALEARGNPPPNTSSSSTGTEPGQIITALAYQHWTSIGAKNISSIMSQYTAHYEAVWFFINGTTSIGPTNGRYDCNMPRGVDNCNFFPEVAWQTFFNKTSWTSYSICNFSLTVGIDQRAVVTATLWYFLTGRNETLRVPYDMDFEYFNGTWAVLRDWVGLEQNPATVIQGLISPACESTSA